MGSKVIQVFELVTSELGELELTTINIFSRQSGFSVLSIATCSKHILGVICVYILHFRVSDEFQTYTNEKWMAPKYFNFLCHWFGPSQWHMRRTKLASASRLRKRATFQRVKLPFSIFTRRNDARIEFIPNSMALFISHFLKFWAYIWTILGEIFSILQGANILTLILDFSHDTIIYLAFSSMI